MTTIASDGLSVAGDSRLLSGTDIVVSSSRVKVRRLCDGSVLGCSGTSIDVEAFVAWLEAGGKGKRPKASDKMSALQLTPAGLVYFGAEGPGIPCDAPMAIGSGGEIAMGAMDAGATPVEAVEIAIDRDPFSGGPVLELALETEAA